MNTELNNIDPVISTIKIGRNDYEVRRGDYILDNGVTYQFISGDGRALKVKGFDRYTTLRISESAFNKLPLEKMSKVKYLSMGAVMTLYIF